MDNSPCSDTDLAKEFQSPESSLPAAEPPLSAHERSEVASRLITRYWAAHVDPCSICLTPGCATPASGAYCQNCTEEATRRVDRTIAFHRRLNDSIILFWLACLAAVIVLVIVGTNTQ